jgi:hypothetical protein
MGLNLLYLLKMARMKAANTVVASPIRYTAPEPRESNSEKEYEHIPMPRKKKRKPRKKVLKVNNLANVVDLSPIATRCTCQPNCIPERITIDATLRLKNEFGKLDYNAQQSMLNAYMRRSMSRRMRIKTVYSVPTYHGGVPSTVCRSIFQRAFGIGKDRVHALLAQMKDPNYTVPKQDARGTHGHQQRTSEVILEEIRIFIELVVSKEGGISHYRRGDSQTLLWFLPARYSYRLLHTEFINATVATYPDKPPIGLSTWYKLMEDEFGYLRFLKPNTDDCATCLNIRYKLMDDAEDQVYWEALSTEHLKLAELGYITMQADCALAVKSRSDFPNNPVKWWTTLIFDFEKNLQIPNIKIKKVYKIID